MFKKTVSPEPPKAAAPSKPADVATKTETKKEVKPVADKITLGYTHLSGCTGCTVALADNYAGLLTLLDKYVDLKYMPTLADARHVQKVDVSFVEGSVCINDKLAVEELKETREKSAVVVALGGCACYGNITRFCRGGQQNQPAHEAYLPIGDIIKVDVYIPGCAPTPQTDQERCRDGIPAPQGNQGTEGSRNCIPQAPHDGNGEHERMLLRPDDQGHQPGSLHRMRQLFISLPGQCNHPRNTESPRASATCASSAVPAITSARGAGSALMWYRTMRRSTRP